MSVRWSCRLVEAVVGFSWEEFDNLVYILIDVLAGQPRNQIQLSAGVTEFSLLSSIQRRTVA
jgi:hypothetical protein